MANAIYPKWKEQIVQGTASALLNGSGTTGLYVALIDTGVYTYNSANEFWDTGGANDPIDAIVGTAQELTSKTFTNGVLDAADTTFTSVSGTTAEALILYVRNAGATTTWRLVAYIDTSVTGLPVTPNGGNITITWNASGIFGL